MKLLVIAVVNFRSVRSWSLTDWCYLVLVSFPLWGAQVEAHGVLWSQLMAVSSDLVCVALLGKL
jgi:hypothetical protein